MAENTNTEREAPSDGELVDIYKRANGEDTGKAQPLTTKRIVNAMRAAFQAGRASLSLPAVGQEPVAYSTGIHWGKTPRFQSEQVVKITREAQPQYGFTYPIYTAPQSAAVPGPVIADELRNMIEGMSVSVDVSTGGHDAGHRYFGTVTEVMDCQGDKHGVTLLVQDAEPNFAHAAAPQPAVAAGRMPIETAPKDGSRILLHPAVEVADDWSKGHWNSEHECWIVGGSPSGVVHTSWHPIPPAPFTKGDSNG